MIRDDWSKEISAVSKDKVMIRGVSISELIKEHSFASTIHLLLKGGFPDKSVEALTEAVMVALIDHGVNTPSIHATRSVLQGGNPLNVAVGAGILSFGDVHGGAIEAAARLFQEGAERPGNPEAIAAEIVGLYAGRKQRIPGYGHRVHTEDPRTVALLHLAKEHGHYGEYCKIAVAVEKVLTQRYKRSLPLNVEGAVAAIISEIGYNWRIGKAFIILGRMTGLLAHTYEDMVREAPSRPLLELDWEPEESVQNPPDK